MHRAEHCDIFERQLRRSVLADRDAAMRPAQIDIRATDRRHAHIVISARKETGEGVGKRGLAARLQSDRDAHHVLLGDISLPEMVRVRVAECLRKCRVLNVARDRDHMRVRSSKPLQREAVCFSRRHLGVFGVIRRGGSSEFWPASAAMFARTIFRDQAGSSVRRLFPLSRRRAVPSRTACRASSVCRRPS